MREEKGRIALAFDLGGTKLHAALVDPEGRILAERLLPTHREKEVLLASFRRTAAELLDQVPGDRRVVATGVGTAGVVKPEGGLITYAPNLPLQEFALGGYLARFCPAPVTVLNDGRAAALGEYAFGELAGVDPMLCLFYGTGIGIGVVIEGRLLVGHDSYAGEIGHTIFDPGGRRCACGKRGCVETLCGGGAMGARAAAEIGPPAAGEEEWSVGAIVRRAGAGEPRAERILADALTGFRVLTANAVTLFNPGALVLGGGVLQGWPELYDLVGEGLVEMVHPAVRANLRTARSRLGSRAILLGAGAAALGSVSS